MIKLLVNFFTSGRPMRLLYPNYFIDKVTSKPVHLYVDGLGRTWMATDRWGWDRVGVNPTTDREHDRLN